jgi:hypothetical protein
MGTMCRILPHAKVGCDGTRMQLATPWQLAQQLTRGIHAVQPHGLPLVAPGSCKLA